MEISIFQPINNCINIDDINIDSKSRCDRQIQRDIGGKPPTATHTSIATAK